MMTTMTIDNDDDADDVDGDDDDNDDDDDGDEKKHLSDHECGSVNDTADPNPQQKTVAEEDLLEPEINPSKLSYFEGSIYQNHHILRVKSIIIFILNESWIHQNHHMLKIHQSTKSIIMLRKPCSKGGEERKP